MSTEEIALAAARVLTMQKELRKAESRLTELLEKEPGLRNAGLCSADDRDKFGSAFVPGQHLIYNCSKLKGHDGRHKFDRLETGRK